MPEIVKSQITRIHNGVNAGNNQNLRTEFEELGQFINLSLKAIKDEASLG